jgi:hypothetical protein
MAGIKVSKFLMPEWKNEFAVLIVELAVAGEDLRAEVFSSELKILTCLAVARSLSKPAAPSNVAKSSIKKMEIAQATISKNGHAGN